MLMKPIVFTIILITILLQSEGACSMWTPNVNIDLTSGRHSPPPHQGWVPTCSRRPCEGTRGIRGRRQETTPPVGLPFLSWNSRAPSGCWDKSICSLNCHQQAQYLCTSDPSPSFPRVTGSENTLRFNNSNNQKKSTTAESPTPQQFHA